MMQTHVGRASGVATTSTTRAVPASIYTNANNVLKPEGGRINLVEWRSAKVKRKCKSTLTAETIAMEAALDAGLHVRTIVAEALYRDYVPTRAASCTQISTARWQ